MTEKHYFNILNNKLVHQKNEVIVRQLKERNLKASWGLENIDAHNFGTKDHW